MNRPVSKARWASAAEEAAEYVQTVEYELSVRAELSSLLRTQRAGLVQGPAPW